MLLYKRRESEPDIRRHILQKGAFSIKFVLWEQKFQYPRTKWAQFGQLIF